MLEPQQRQITREGGGGEGGDNWVGFEFGFEELVGFVPGVQEAYHLISRMKLLGGDFHEKGKERQPAVTVDQERNLGNANI